MLAGGPTTNNHYSFCFNRYGMWHAKPNLVSLTQHWRFLTTGTNAPNACCMPRTDAQEQRRDTCLAGLA